MAADAPVRVVLVTMDSHLSSAAARAEAALRREMPGLVLTVHAADEWGSDPQALAECHADIARGRLAYSLFSVASLPLAPGTMLRSDGLRSIRRSFTADELAARLPAGWSAARPAPFRVAAVHRPEEERWPLR